MIFTNNADYRSEYSLARWKEILDDRLFFRCHRSYIVNVSRLASIEEGIARLETGEKVMVSRRKHTALVQAYANYETHYR